MIKTETIFNPDMTLDAIGQAIAHHYQALMTDQGLQAELKGALAQHGSTIQRMANRREFGGQRARVIAAHLLFTQQADQVDAKLIRGLSSRLGRSEGAAEAQLVSMLSQFKQFKHTLGEEMEQSAKDGSEIKTDTPSASDSAEENRFGPFNLTLSQYKMPIFQRASINSSPNLSVLLDRIDFIRNDVKDYSADVVTLWKNKMVLHVKSVKPTDEEVKRAETVLGQDKGLWNKAAGIFSKDEISHQFKAAVESHAEQTMENK